MEIIIGIVVMVFILFVMAKTVHGIGRFGCRFMSEILSFFSNIFGGGEISTC